MRHTVIDPMGVFGRFLDGEHPEGLPRTRTRATHPYNYDPFVIWQSGDERPATETVYSDRLWQWDHKKHDELCKKHFSNRGQYWNQRDPKAIEAFLRDYNDEPNLVLTRVTEYCNQSNGYPCWRFDYRVNHSETPRTLHTNNDSAI